MTKSIYNRTLSFSTSSHFGKRLVRGDDSCLLSRSEREMIGKHLWV